MEELLRANAEVIVVGPNTGVEAAKAATSTVPIVMAGATDPEATGLIDSLSKPGGNVTGLALNSASLTAKRLELLREILPNASRIAYVVDPKAPGTSTVMRDLQEAARALSFQLAPAPASTVEELQNVLASCVERRADAFVVSAAIVFWTHRRRIVDFCAHHRIPAIYSYREPVVDGE